MYIPEYKQIKNKDMDKELKFTYILVIICMDVVLRNEMILKVDHLYQRFYTDEDEHRVEVGFGTKDALTEEQMDELSQGLHNMNTELRLLGYTNFLDNIHCHIYKDRKWNKLLQHH